MRPSAIASSEPTPITAIVSSVAALEAGAIDEPGERERFLAHIGRESRRMATMVEALLRLASLERGTGRPLIELVPLRLLLDEVLGACGIAPARCECRAEIAVVGARGLLAQALANVLSNAAHHAGPDGLVVRAALERATVTLDVTDSGPGVPSDERDRIFERFYRGSGRGPGSGLGLALARTAIEASRGTLELLPQRPGEGATFRFTLPGAQLL